MGSSYISSRGKGFWFRNELTYLGVKILRKIILAHPKVNDFARKTIELWNEDPSWMIGLQIDEIFPTDEKRKDFVSFLKLAIKEIKVFPEVLPVNFFKDILSEAEILGWPLGNQEVKTVSFVSFFDGLIKVISGKGFKFCAFSPYYFLLRKNSKFSPCSKSWMIRAFPLLSHRIVIPLDYINSQERFHHICKQCFGFPSDYEFSFDAWEKCMTSIDKKNSSLTDFKIETDDEMVFEFVGSSSEFQKQKDLLQAIFNSIEKVNRRFENFDQFTKVKVMFTPR